MLKIPLANTSIDEAPDAVHEEFDKLVGRIIAAKRQAAAAAPAK